MKLFDIRLQIDGLILPDDKNIEDVIKEIEAIVKTQYPIQFDVDYEEYFK